jgi:hypothetical protein
MLFFLCYTQVPGPIVLRGRVWASIDPQNPANLQRCAII